MATGPKYKVPFSRRRQKKTDYKARLALVRSRKPRLVVRISNKNVLAQVIEYNASGDKTLVSAFSKELDGFGWKAANSNLPAAYLVGFLCGLRAKKAGLDKAVLDIGFRSAVKGSIPFAVLKGAVDAGIDVPHSEDILPAPDRLNGEHITEYAEKLKNSDKEKYKRVFSGYLKRGLAPEELAKHVTEVKKAINSKESK